MNNQPQKRMSKYEFFVKLVDNYLKEKTIMSHVLIFHHNYQGFDMSADWSIVKSKASLVSLSVDLENRSTPECAWKYAAQNLLLLWHLEQPISVLDSQRSNYKVATTDECREWNHFHLCTRISSHFHLLFEICISRQTFLLNCAYRKIVWGANVSFCFFFSLGFSLILPKK